MATKTLTLLASQITYHIQATTEKSFQIEAGNQTVINSTASYVSQNRPPDFEANLGASGRPDIIVKKINGHLTLTLFDKNNQKVAEIGDNIKRLWLGTDFQLNTRLFFNLWADPNLPAGSRDASLIPGGIAPGEEKVRIFWNLDEDQFATGKLQLTVSGRMSGTGGTDIWTSAGRLTTAFSPAWIATAAGEGILDIEVPFTVTETA